MQANENWLRHNCTSFAGPMHALKHLHYSSCMHYALKMTEGMPAQREIIGEI